MKFVALISGGKDSCFNMMSCITEGHEIVALANLRPETKDELDSYMFQTVGHHAIDLYAEAMDLPLYVGTIKGSSLSIGRDYSPIAGDEVEDLYELLLRVKAERDIEAVSVGAILSDYQRIRVENVCQRLGLKVLAFLWRRNQEILLKEMIDCDLKAIIIKVAALGLLPDKHLGMELKEIFPHMVKMKEKYGLNECGEGGEYETFVFDCPLFKKSIVIEETELVMHSNDAFAPVGYLNLKRCHLKEKPKHDVAGFLRNVDKLSLTTSTKWLAKQLSGVEEVSSILPNNNIGAEDVVRASPTVFYEYAPFACSDGSNFQIAGIQAILHPDNEMSVDIEAAMNVLEDHIEKLGHRLSDITSLSLYVQNMSHYADINNIYIQKFGINPPVRICIQVCLPKEVLFQLDCHGCKTDDLNSGNDRRTMHVQSLSHWAPANIGPFSQAVLTGKKLCIAGTIGLVPADLTLIGGGVAVQAKVALNHVISNLKAMWSPCTLAHCPMVHCFVTRKESIAVAKIVFNSKLSEGKEMLPGSVCLSPCVQYCVVPGLPKGASVEWQLFAWTFEDSDEENITGSHFKRTFPYYTLSFDCTWFEQRFSCRIQVYSNTSDDADVKQLAENLLGEYCKLVNSQQKTFEKGLAKIFYSAEKFSQHDIVKSFTQNLPQGININKLPVISFVPVISLEEEGCLLSWCQ